MNSRGKLGLSAIVMIVALVAGASLAPVTDAKKKAGGNVVRPVGAPGAVPEGPSSRDFAPVPLVQTVTVGKKGRGFIIADVDVTISVAAVPSPGSANALADLVVRLTGPSGATTDILSGGRGIGKVGGNVVSNLTLSDETPTLTCGAAADGTPPPPPPPPCNDPDATLFPPYSGTAYPDDGALSTLYGYKMRGTYTLKAFDTCGPGNLRCEDHGTATITGWQLRIKGEAL
jgi:hypothetical protein